MKPVVNYISVCSGIEAASVAMSRIPGVDWCPVAFSEIDPFACSVLAYHFPAVPNLGDLSKIRYDKERDELTNGTDSIPLHGRRIHAILGGTPCFVAGTMVLTPGGYVPIETLRVGDEVIAGSGAVRKVEAVGSKMAEVGTLKVLGRPEIDCTPNHPFMCIRMKRDFRRSSPTFMQKIPIDDYTETRADESVGMYVGRVRTMEVPAPPFPKCYEATEEDLMNLAGWYIGDGYIRRFAGKTKKTVVLALCSEGKIKSFVGRFAGRIHFCVGKDGKVAVSCTALADWLSENFGEGAPNKRIPYWVYGRRDAMLLVDGYGTTDGCRVKGGTKFVTVSPALAYGLADLLGDAAVHVVHVPRTTTICGRTVNQRDWYSVDKADNGGIRTKFINGRYASIARSYKHGATGSLRRVYNISVADEHTYIANGLFTHNCQDLSVAGKRAGAERGSGTRSALFYEYARLVDEIRPDWILWENVPGVLSSRDGRDFYAVQDSLVDCGYGLAWRILDAQYTVVDGFPRAVPQRRKRVWLVGCAGGDEHAAAQILFERPGLLGDTPPSREAGKGFACPVGYRVAGDDRLVGFTAKSCGNGQLNQTELEEVAKTLDTAQAVCIGKEAYNIGEAGQGSLNISEDGTAQTVRADTHLSAVAVATFENHAQDSRVKEIEVSDMRSQKDGTGGNNLPLVVASSATFGKTGHAVNAAGDGEKYAPVEVAQTLNTFQNQSDARAVDLVVAIDGNKLLKNERAGGSGLGVSTENVMYTETARDAKHHAVAVRTANTHANGHGVAEEVSHTIDLAQGQAVAIFENHAQDSRVRPTDAMPTMGASNANSAGVSGNNPLVVFSKASHARNKNSDGERYEASEVAQTRNTFDNGESRAQEVVCSVVGFSHSNSNTSIQTKPTPECSMTLRSVPTDEGAAVISVDRLNQSTATEVMHTIKANAATGDGEPTVSIGFKAGQSANGGLGDEREVSPTLAAQPSALEPTVAVGVDTFNQTLTGDVSRTLNSSATDTDHIPVVLHHIVRRLTVIECSRLQGFPDLWLKFPTGHMRKIDKAEYDYLYGIPELRKYLRTPADSLRGEYETDLPSDSAAYRALGNSMATNCVEWILRRIVAAMRLGII